MAAHREFRLTLHGPDDVKSWEVSENAANLLFGMGGNIEPLVAAWLQGQVLALIREKLVGNAAQQADEVFAAEVKVID